MIKKILAGQLRHLLSGFGGAFVGFMLAKGVSIDSLENILDSLEYILGAALYFVAAASSAIDKKKLPKEDKVVKRMKGNYGND